MKKQYITPNAIVVDVTIDCRICDPSITGLPADASTQLAPQINFDEIMDFNSDINKEFLSDLDVWK